MRTNMMYRRCSNCSERSVLLSGLLFSRAVCQDCNAIIGAGSICSAVFFVITLVLTITTTAAVMGHQGFYAGLLWLPFPIGAMGYLKARYCPLEVKADDAPVAKGSDS